MAEPIVCVRSRRGCVAALVLSVLVGAQQPTLLRDIGATPRTDAPDAWPRDWCFQRGRTWFIADDVAYGTEPWSTDGTVAGTTVLDVVPGTLGRAEQLTAFAGDLYFVEFERIAAGLWRTDGTPSGTVRLLDLGGGTNEDIPRHLRVLGPLLLFVATDVEHGRELWSTDGSIAGTRLFVDVAPGAVGSDPRPLVEVAGRLLFSAYTPELGRELWVTDGTVAGTQLVGDLRAGTSNAADLLGFVLPDGDRAVVSTTNGLWVTAGLPGDAVRIRSDVVAWRGPTVTVGEFVYFAGEDVAHGRELWRTDGTPGGTSLVFDALAGVSSSYALPFGRAGGRVLFETWRPSAVWALDDALGVPESLLDGGSATSGVAFDGEFVFCGSLAGRGHVWRTDGTVVGTRALRDDLDAAGDFGPKHGGRAWFVAKDVAGYEPWTTDGTAGGTARFTDLATWPPGATVASKPRWNASRGDDVVTVAFDGVVDALWRTDGTPHGTARVATFPGVEPFRGQVTDEGARIVVAGERTFVLASDPAVHRRYQLWCGDTSGFAELTTIDMLHYRFDPVGFGRRFALDLTEGLLVSDGSVAGTRLLALNPAGETWANSLAAVGATLFFDAYDGVQPIFCRTEGTSVTVVAQPTPRVRGATAGNGLLFFVGWDAAHGIEPWQSDGTAAGTILIADLLPGADSSDPRPVARAASGAVLFAATDATRGEEPWLWTGDGPTLVSFPEIAPGIGPLTGTVGGGVAIGESFAITADDGIHGAELWWLETHGPRLVVDLMPGRVGSQPRQHVRVGDEVWFVADEPHDGRGLWRSDGTAAGTRFVMRLRSDSGLDVLDGKVVAWLDDLQVGIEPFLLAVGPTVVPWGSGCPRGMLQPWLDATAPRLGDTLTLRGGGGAAGMPGCVALGRPAVLPVAVGSDADCQCLLDPTTVAVVASQADARLAWAWSVPLPAAPVLEGLVLAAQSWSVTTDGHLVASRGLRLTCAAR